MRNLKDYIKELLITFWRNLPRFMYQEFLYTAVQQDQTYLKNHFLLKTVNSFHYNLGLSTYCTFRLNFGSVRYFQFGSSAILLPLSIRAHSECRSAF